MDREKQFAADLQALRALCDEATSREERQQLLQLLSRHAFAQPEHQVVFESICVLFRHGPVSLPQLRVHLNNRGFPDVDVETYFQAPLARHAQPLPSDKVTP